MKFTITIEDREDGRVNVDSKPHMKTLVAMARGGDLTPAAGYALAALSKIISDSRKQTAEKVINRFEGGDIPMFQSDRKMFS